MSAKKITRRATFQLDHIILLYYLIMSKLLTNMMSFGLFQNSIDGHAGTKISMFNIELKHLKIYQQKLLKCLGQIGMTQWANKLNFIRLYTSPTCVNQKNIDQAENKHNIKLRQNTSRLNFFNAHTKISTTNTKNVPSNPNGTRILLCQLHKTGRSFCNRRKQKGWQNLKLLQLFAEGLLFTTSRNSSLHSFLIL